MSETVSEQAGSGIGLPSFSKKTKVIAAISLVTLLAGGVVAQTAGAKAVSLGSNGIDINMGELDMNGNDVVSGATTVWDASAGQVPASVIDYSGATASDVGLGNVENEAAVAETGDTMNGSYTLDGSITLSGLGDKIDIDAGDLDFGINNDAFISSYQPSSGTDALQFDGEEMLFSLGGPGEECEMYANGTLSCTGTKNWVHSLNETHEAVYTSQESPKVRAVYEGQATVNDGKVTVELPSHFEKTVSDTRPSLRVQATPHELATVAVTERSDSSLTIEASKDVTVDYRVTGIREGYEDKQVVREKE